MATHRLTVDQARHAAVRAQLLDADRPAALLPMVEHLTFLQLDHSIIVCSLLHFVDTKKIIKKITKKRKRYKIS